MHAEAAAQIARILTDAEKLAHDVDDSRPIVAKLRAMRLEYERAVTMSRRATEAALAPEIRAAGAIERGEFVMLGPGPRELRRVTDTGIEVMDAGFPQWHNISSRSAPLVVCDEDRS